ncbi:MAG: hypothetical protein N2712_06190, partial [Brevinematales bacterium]|nr:hypothetical protein [Brevinematales bacterium]
MMVNYRLLLLLMSFTFIFSSFEVFGVTANEKNIVVRVLSSWDPFAMGWEPDELLISPTNVLNKQLNAIVDQNDLTNNGGRMLTYFGSPYQNKCEPTNDSVYPGKETDTLTKAELSELWLTWDTNFIYFALRGQQAGLRNNIMIYFDREPGKGRVNFDTGVVWDRRVYFSGMDPDMYIGSWSPDNKVEFDPTVQNKGGFQLYSVVAPGATGDAYISSYT